MPTYSFALKNPFKSSRKRNESSQNYNSELLWIGDNPNIWVTLWLNCFPSWQFIACRLKICTDIHFLPREVQLQISKNGETRAPSDFFNAKFILFCHYFCNTWKKCVSSVWKLNLATNFSFRPLALFSLTAYRNKGIPYTLAHTTIDLLHNTFANLWKFQCEPPHAHVLHIQWKSSAKRTNTRQRQGNIQP